MVKMVKRILLCLLVFCTLSANAMAADVPVIVQLGPLGNILNVLNVLGGFDSWTTSQLPVTLDEAHLV